eukprot:TRINITY_DN11384_c1_g1_i3.p1 TRINITY_DN11384_c1_g1~~TRINITY_DN11384_c1_g1_i3.p1  ORF type:complete len:236 (-),score=-8.07 TRINITY_DN11384_c1_g1_i3:93-800(-)
MFLFCNFYNFDNLFHKKFDQTKNLTLRTNVSNFLVTFLKDFPKKQVQDSYVKQYSQYIYDKTRCKINIFVNSQFAGKDSQSFKHNNMLFYSSLFIICKIVQRIEMGTQQFHTGFTVKFSLLKFCINFVHPTHNLIALSLLQTLLYFRIVKQQLSYLLPAIFQHPFYLQFALKKAFIQFIVSVLFFLDCCRVDGGFFFLVCGGPIFEVIVILRDCELYYWRQFCCDNLWGCSFGMV